MCCACVCVPNQKSEAETILSSTQRFKAWMDGWMHGWIDGWMEEWLDGLTNR